MKTTVITVSGPSYVCIPTYALPIGTIVKCKDKFGESEFVLDYIIVSKTESPVEYVVETIYEDKRFWRALKLYDEIPKEVLEYASLNLDEGTYYIIEPN